MVPADPIHLGVVDTCHDELILLELLQRGIRAAHQTDSRQCIRTAYPVLGTVVHLRVDMLQRERRVSKSPVP